MDMVHVVLERCSNTLVEARRGIDTSIGLPRGVSGREVVGALSRLGFDERHGKGDHVVMRNQESHRVTPVPLHDEVGVGTLASILRKAGVSREELAQALHG